MIPVKLRIEGFLSYREAVELDFTSFNLACISGANGAGKSALLDAMTWALFGQARKRDESIINNHPSVKAAVVIFDFDFEGARYRVQRINPRGKPTTVDFFIEADAGEDRYWKSLTEHTLRETNAKIESTLRMDFDTFTNASFFLQGKADQFASARPADRKRILNNILGLEIWETYRDAASQKRRDFEKTVKSLEGRLSEIQSELDEEPQRIERLKTLKARLADVSKQRQERASILENIRSMLAALDEQSRMLAAYQIQIDIITRNRGQVLETLSTRREEKLSYAKVLSSAPAIEKAYQDWQSTYHALEAMEAVAIQFRQRESLRQEPLGIVQAEEARLREALAGLTQQHTTLLESLNELETLTQQLSTSREKIAIANQKLEERGLLQAEAAHLQTQQAEAKAENPRLREEMNELQARIQQLQAAEGVECPLCGGPLNTDDRKNLIENLQQDGLGLGDRYRANKKLLENVEEKLSRIGAKLADLNNVEVNLREATRQADQLELQIANLTAQQQAWEKNGAPRLAEIRTALETGAFALEARTRLAEIDAELKALGYELEAHEKLRQAENAGRDAQEQLHRLETARAALAPIEREIASIENQLVNLEENLREMTSTHDEAAIQYSAAQAAMPDLRQAETALYDIQEQENQLRQDVGGATQNVVALESLKQRKSAMLEEREGLSQQIADLKQLERAFGKDGIPALLIEQALPEIETATNTLLSRLSHGRMSFNFVTQREYKDASREDLKETLDMVISDGVGQRDYEMYSGGEAFRVNFAIRVALSQMLARRAGARLQTLVIDEGFGSQDAQGRQLLVEAINLVQEDFEKILVITHLDELKDAFSTRIEVEKTPLGSQLQVV
ncbi:MAG TPA: SMC family ATPase [Brevefilum fermentans]|jgi:exonuclease SbcC|nr:SMC family ATPase [Brevefilum fermentans]